MKKYNYELIKSLIFFNLYVLELKSLNKKLSQHRSFFKNLYSSSSNYKILDLFEIAKQVKQIIRILQYLKKKQGGLLHIINEDQFFIQLLENRNIVDPSKLCKISFRKESFKKKIKQTATVFTFLKSKKKAYTNFFTKNIFIINNMSDNFNIQDFGIYKTHNNFNDWRKIVFILILLKKFYEKNF